MVDGPYRGHPEMITLDMTARLRASHSGLGCLGGGWGCVGGGGGRAVRRRARGGSICVR
jgi:hypothetical protein